MSTVSIPAPVSTSRTQTYRCSGCHGQFSLPADSFVLPLLCPACKHSAALAEAVKLLNDAIALRDGTGIFKDLNDDERREQLQAIGLTARPSAVVRFDAAHMPQVVRNLASDTLIDVAGVAADEIARRLGSTDLADADRVVVPTCEACPSADEYAVDSSLRIEIENQIEDEARELVMAQESAEQPERWDGLA